MSVNFSIILISCDVNDYKLYIEFIIVKTFLIKQQAKDRVWGKWINDIKTEKRDDKKGLKGLKNN